MLPQANLNINIEVRASHLWIFGLLATLSHKVYLPLWVLNLGFRLADLKWRAGGCKWVPITMTAYRSEDGTVRLSQP